MVDEETIRRAQALADEEGRAELTAESFSRGMRIGLLLITMFGEMLMLSFVVAAVFYPAGMLDYDPFLAVYLGGILVGMGFFLMVIYGGLAGNNPRLNAGGRMTWFMAFASIGPIALPAYWFIHIWPAPLEPWTDPDLSHAPQPRLQHAHAH